MKNNLISVLDIDEKNLEKVFTFASKGEQLFSEYRKSLDSKVLASLFLQPSTRTQLSFQSAFAKLGGRFIGFSDINASRSGPPYFEPIDDMGYIVSQYCDIIVLRTINAKYTYELEQGSRVPVISAGSGNIEHPTQALTDLFTLRKAFGANLTNLEVLIIGTPRQRTINSLLLGLSRWDNINVHILCQKGVTLSDYVLEKISSTIKIKYYSSSSEFFMKNNSKVIDVLYMDKIFSETFEYNEFSISYTELCQNFRNDIIILHPLPRTKELPKSFDKHPGAMYFEQAKNGLFVRGGLFLSYFTK